MGKEGIVVAISRSKEPMKDKVLLQVTLGWVKEWPQLLNIKKKKKEGTYIPAWVNMFEGYE